MYIRQKGNSRAPFEKPGGDGLMDIDDAQRRFIPSLVEKGDTPEVGSVTRTDHEDDIVSLPRDLLIGVCRNLSGIHVSRMGCDETENLPPNRVIRHFLEIIKDIPFENSRISRVP